MGKIIIAAGLTDVGRERESNQDAYRIAGIAPSIPTAPIESNLIVVADGMGGHRAGEVASKLAVDTIIARYADPAPRRSHEGFMRTAIAGSGWI